MTDAKRLFQKNLTQALKSGSWLERSLRLVSNENPKMPLAASTADLYEMLSSRFSRAVDILTTRLWRSLDSIELEEPGTLIDAINRAHKRGIIDDPAKIRQSRELRNQIAHEYEDEKLALLWVEIRQLAPSILVAINATEKYAKSKGYIS